VLDITSDLGVPAYVALNATVDGANVLFGFGAHVDPVIACVRALTEVAQFASSLPEPGQFRSGNAVEDAWMAEVTTESEAWLAPTHMVQLPPAPPLSSVTAALDGLIDQLSLRGLPVFRVQATRRDIGLPVARVIVPGLRHFWNRFAPGRLYDVPLQLGWVPAEFGEAELNPRWMFL
jgi:ribosomal protein S12 methylthiotransferase accessory factor